ncbi:TRAP-type C4-dicarboxylate transport system, small permease component [Rhizobiales bacterium GAS188]|nr:TRAP-type C4-dicarboxylate transport system, small permease component [Rhizobiales bacterium GAS188]
MSAGRELSQQDAEVAAPEPLRGTVGTIGRVMRDINRLIVALGGLAFVAASLILSYSVFARYWLRIATDWQDEAAIFLLVGAIFFSAAAVQARRGHIAIDAIAALLSDRANRLRLLLCDLTGLLFCAFFAWKSWTLTREAWVDDQISNSTWGPPLWIPYALMAAGMTLLAVQIFLQVCAAPRRDRHR